MALMMKLNELLEVAQSGGVCDFQSRCGEGTLQLPELHHFRLQFRNLCRKHQEGFLCLLKALGNTPHPLFLLALALQ